ncbi:MAG: GHKL domain-containing protein [Bacteroidetes bacterium]|nr:MAG: GHKL domain-containing protein [Bacteroidota bacterium]
MQAHPLFGQLDIQQLALDSALSLVLLAILLIYVVNLLGFYKPHRYIFLYVISAALILTGIWEFALDLLLDFIYTIPADKALADQMFWYRFFFTSLIVAGTITISWLYYKNYELQAELERHKEGQSALADAELFKLRQQLQPHFLFNSLNSINALIGVDPPLASKMVLQLSEFFRGSLKREDKKFISLQEEIDYLKLYLEIEQVRFGHRLQTQLIIKPGCEKLMVPPLVLQPLMENAIKFGLYGTIGQVKIQLDASCDERMLYIRIENPFDPEGSGIRGTGFGLSSIRRRLYLLFERNDLLQTKVNEGLFVAELKLPIYHV